jgi:hypothetical protein
MCTPFRLETLTPTAHPHCSPTRARRAIASAPIVFCLVGRYTRVRIYILNNTNWLLHCKVTLITYTQPNKDSVNHLSTSVQWSGFGATISRYWGAVILRILFPYITIGMIVSVMDKLINPHAMNIFRGPLSWIHGLIAKGTPMLIAFRRNATPVKASPVICWLID